MHEEFPRNASLDTPPDPPVCWGHSLGGLVQLSQANLKNIPRKDGPLFKVRLVEHEMVLGSDGSAPHLGFGAVLLVVAVLHIRT